MGIIVTPNRDNWKPKSAAQDAALHCPADVLLLGGAAGSLKSETLLVDATEYYDNAEYHAVIFRKSYPELRALMERSQHLYSNLGGKFNQSEKVWMWPWGSTIEFRYLERDSDVFKHQGFEYQFAGFDESTHFLESQIRYIIQSRMRSKFGLRQKVRLATNPGNRGHKYHKSMFIGQKCHHCVEELKIPWPKKNRKPFTLYNDATWSDGVPLGMSTMFIPGKVTDHTIFGAGGGDYAKKLMGLPLKLQLALLSGCWEAFEGQYFDCWNPTEHVVARDTIKEKSWWPYWVSIDYGFGHATVAYLWTRAPDGMVYVLDEYIVHRRKATDVALDLQKLWGVEYPIKAWYLSPDAVKQHHGESDFTRAELMSKATGILFDAAYDDRVSGAMLLYTLLSNNQMRVCDNCELLQSAIPTRIHDEEHNVEDVLKVETEDEDDSYDGWRYGAASHINPSKRPVQEEIDEHVTSTDPTCAMIQYQQAIAKINDRNKPMFYRRGARSK